MDASNSVNTRLRTANPKTTANFISILFYWWVLPIIKRGREKELNAEDLYQVLPEDRSELLGQKLLTEWKKELEKANHSKGKPSLAKAMIRTFLSRLLLAAIICLLEECFLRIIQPVLLGKLLLYFDPAYGMSSEIAYLYATGLLLALIAYIFTHHQYFLLSYHIGMQMRVAACSAIYSKCMLLSQKALGQSSIGQMVNIMSNDVNRYDLSVNFLPYILVGPIQAVISTIVLYFTIGPSCFVGLGVLVLYVPMQSWFGQVFSKLRAEMAKKTDQRIRAMNEMITGMRVIKMYTWENPFANIVNQYRRVEVEVIKRTVFLRALNQSLFFTSSKLFIFFILIVYVVTGNELTSDKVFLTVALFNNIRLVMTLFFPSAIRFGAEALISTRRIQDFLLLDEKTTNDSSEASTTAQLINADCLVDCNQVTVKWPAASETEENTLTNVSFTVRPGKLLAVIGQVGSGKTSLLNVILGELSPTSGQCRTQGRIAYASQEPWIFSSSIRQNILCGCKYDARRYKKVVKASALEKDFGLFPQGDQTIVGERGVSLSGGQKARVNLARCLYVDADIYLLDDPLSAVDTHVGRHLFDQAVNGFLRGKIRVLVTHQLQYLKDVDEILVLKAGRVEAIGTYEELSKGGVDFAKVMVEDDVDNEPSEAPQTIMEDETRSSRSSSVRSLRNRRSPSITSKTSIREESPALAEESRSSGDVSMGVYWKYFRAGGNWASLSFLIFSCLFTQILFSASDFWLNIWTNAEEIRTAFSNSTLTSTNASSQPWKDHVDTVTGIYVYSILIGGVFVFSMIRTVNFFILCMLSSFHLHNKMFQSVIRAPLLFFDRNPVGRILNRFAKDVGCMDDQLPASFYDAFSFGLNGIGIIVTMAVVDLWLVLPIVFLSILFYTLSKVYLMTARAVKRLEATTRSPVFTHLSSSLVGLTTLRAHNCQPVFQHVFDQRQNEHSAAFYMYLMTSRWFGYYLDWIAVIYVACVTYISTALYGTISGSEAGLVITSALTLTGLFQWAVRQSAETENQMTSVERVIEYGQLPSEAALESSVDKKPPPMWPSHGNVQLDGMSLRYNDVDQPVLKCITCTISAKEKIGIVGRTGAGKSSLIASLFRLAEPEGRVIIDGIDSKSIGLHELRSKISIIPQDPFLFSGTLRRNLDPFDEYDDSALWKALEDVKFKESMADLDAGLDSAITEGGSNLSVGQRQLVCLARAILRQNRILVLDEATANVDQKTDSLIQLTIREKFVDCTVLTIAHRLNTIMDSDKVMVLDAGCLIEFDEPSKLLEKESGLFHGLVQQTGPLEAARLTCLAKEASEKRRENVTTQINFKRPVAKLTQNGEYQMDWKLEQTAL